MDFSCITTLVDLALRSVFKGTIVTMITAESQYGYCLVYRHTTRCDHRRDGQTMAGCSFIGGIK